MSKKVALMVGHGKTTSGSWDCGCAYAGNTEAALMLPITKAAVKYLRQSGVTVISDADTNNNKNMVVDVAWANKEKADIYVSVHCDWYKAPTGVYPLYVSTKGKALANALNNAIKSGMGMKSRGLCRRTDLWELNGTNMPACILETGSIKADIKTLKSADKYGKCIAKGICAYIGVKFKELSEPVKPSTPAAKAPSPTTYRVRKTWADAKSQVGAYTVLANAKKVADEKGLNVYDDKGTLIYQGKKPAPVAKPATPSGASKILAKAKEYCWPKGTPEKKWAYTTGAPLATYKEACKKYMKKTAKVSLSDCGYFISACVRAAGLSSTFVALDWKKALPSGFEIVHKGAIGSFKLQPGDIIRYKKTNGAQHVLMIYDSSSIAEAGRKYRFPVIRADNKKYDKSDVKKNTIEVIRVLEKKTEVAPKTIADKGLDACKVQAEWMKNYTYKWESKPTVEKSKKYGTCVTYVACVLQRIGVLKSGEYIWHNGKGKVVGSKTGKMSVTYPGGTIKGNKSKLKAGDIILAGNKASVEAGGNSHIFVLAGNWDGDNPYIYDNNSAERIKNGKAAIHTYNGSRNIIAIVRLKG